jgi:hypothetical protein
MALVGLTLSHVRSQNQTRHHTIGNHLNLSNKVQLKFAALLAQWCSLQTSIVQLAHFNFEAYLDKVSLGHSFTLA